MLLNYIKNLKFKIISSVLLMYLIVAVFTVTYAESYEWTLIEDMDVVTTNSNIEENTNTENKTSVDIINLECESAILIEQNTRKNFV